MTTWFGRESRKARRQDRSRTARRPSGRVTLRAEPLEDRLLLSLAPKLLLDINPGGSSKPYGFTQVNNLTFFGADDGTHGSQLWATNGTVGGTFLVADINNPNLGNAYPSDLTNVNGTLFFSANDGTSGLWESNGTAAGTFLVASPLMNNSFPSNLTNVNGTLFFQANDSVHGPQLWESNGTTAGTFMVADINPSTNGFNPSALTNVNGTLFFEANDGTHGYELWKSNGTAAGTVMVADINPSSDSYPYILTNVNGALFFTANDGVHGTQLWESNGTAAGTQMAADINPSGGAYPEHLANLNGTLFFTAYEAVHGRELWGSNGTAAGTFMVQDINPGIHGSYAYYLTNVNGTLFFTANDGTHGYQLWESNGTTASAVTGVNLGSGGSRPGNLTNVNGTLFFAADDGTHGTELWESNGSAAGTLLVADLNPGSGSNPNYLTNVSGALFFGADDGTHGREPWILPVSTLTTTTISSSPNSSVFGQAVTFTGTVSAQAPGAMPTGTVDFKEGTTDLTPGGVTLTGGQATFTTAALTVGSHTITAVYSGDSNLSGSQGNDAANPQAVNQAATSMSFAAGPDVSLFGQSVVFFAFVAPVAPGAGIATGSVTFKEGATVLASSVSLSGGHASFAINSLSVGSHTITAFYSGDGNFLGSNSSTIEVVNQAGTTTALTSKSAVFGQQVVFTASVSAPAPSSVMPTGTVDFKEGAADLTPGGVTLSGGRATFSTATLTVGQHTITASYSGNAQFAASQANDAAAPEVINQASSRTVLFAFPDPAVFGQVVSFTVALSVLAPGRGTPTGTLTFLDGTTTIGSVSLSTSSGGRATFTTASLSRGNHAINVNYGGNSNFLASSYNNFGETVQRDSTTTTVTASANPAVLGTSITFTAAVQANSPGAGTATGTVTFKDITTVLGTGTLNASGQATFTTSQLALGTHAITATYGGDNNFTTSVSAILGEVVQSSLKAASQPTASHFSATNLGLVTTSYTQRTDGTSPASSAPVLLSTNTVASRVDDYFVTIMGRRRRSQTAPINHSIIGDDWLD
jgi:ELWxxDGT repeat protein